MSSKSKSPRLLFAVCRPAGAIADDERAEILRLTGLSAADMQVVSLIDPNAPDPARDLDLTQFDATIISGSPFGFSEPESEKTPAHKLVEQRADALMNRLVAADLPTLAICYGLQAVTLSHGGTLTGEYPEDLQAPLIHLTEAGRNDRLTRMLPTDFRSYAGHADAVAQLPPGAVVLARGDFCPVQLLRLGNNVYGTQFHPEITTEGMRIRIREYGNKYYPAHEKAAVEQRCYSADVTGGNYLITAFAQLFLR